MAKNFSLFLALRYLKPKRTYVSIITLISVLGVALGVTVLIVVIAVMTGFEKRLEKLILGFEPHLMVQQQVIVDPLESELESGRWDILKDRLKKEIPEIKAVAPYVTGQVLLQFDVDDSRRQAALMMMGVDSEGNPLTERVKEIINAGELDLSYKPEHGKYGCLISMQFAQRNGITIGEHIEAFSTADIEPIVANLFDAIDNNQLSDDELRSRVKELTESIKTPKDMIVTGIFDSVRYGEMILVPLEIGQDLYELGADVHGLSIELEDPFLANQINKKISALLPFGWNSETWIQRNKQLFATIRNERGMMYFVLFFIILVAAFSTMNTMITVTVQKRHEIGVMKALGARVFQIVGVFIGQGLIVGLIGSVSGLAAGSLVLYNRNGIRDVLAQRLGLEIFPEEMYGIAEIPAQIVPSDIAIICFGAFLLCTLAALPPAYMVARLDPAKALRD
ncbi:MAG TPA: FtsX-like permease family protein [Verrucomicrobia bacterium]|nr:FtsX-like permease family protein [Verrucomicrobiales bacterium]HIL54093.1 FtsX-like permease family protein [Verrucomicrobiota bacterium]